MTNHPHHPVQVIEIILVGTLLLALPISARSGESQGLFTAFFTATSATCVTGLLGQKLTGQRGSGKEILRKDAGLSSNL